MSLKEYTERVYLLGGDVENVNVLSLTSRYSPEGSVNMRASELGTLDRVDGYRALNGAETTDTGGSTAKVTGLYHYRSHSEGIVTRRQVKVVDDGADECEVWHSTDGGSNWSFLKDLGPLAVGLVPSFLQVENSLTISFGGDVVVQEYDGTTCTEAGQEQPDAPTVTASVARGALTGVFKYKTAEIDDDDDKTVGPASEATDAIFLHHRDGELTDIDDGPGGTRIFRTLGDGEIFFWVTDIDVDETTYTDVMLDRDLLAKDSENVNAGSPPPAGSRIGTAHRARPFYAGTDEFPNRLWWGTLGRSDAVGTSDFLRIGEGEDGDEVVALWPEYEGELVIFKENSIWRLSGDGRKTWNLDRTGAGMGTVGKNSVAQVPAGAVFTDSSGKQQVTGKPSLVYMTPTDVRLFDGMSDTVISWPKQDTFARHFYPYRKRSWCALYPPYSWVLFCFTSIDSGADTPSAYIAWDYARGTWHEVDFLPHSMCAALTEMPNVNNVLMIGEARVGTGAYVYQAFSGTSAAGSDITAKVRTIPMTFQVPEKTKTLRSFDPIFGAASGPLTVTLNFYTGYASTDATAFSTKTVDIEGADVNQVNPGPVYPKNTSGVYPRDEAHVAEVVVTGTDAWSLFGWTSTYQSGPGWVR